MTPEVTTIVLNKIILLTFGLKQDHYHNMSDQASVSDQHAIIKHYFLSKKAASSSVD
jgi:hypothetical protein